MNLLNNNGNNNLDDNKYSAIKCANVKVGKSFCLGEQNSSKDDKIDVTSEDFLNKLTPELSKKIKETLRAAEIKAENIIQNANIEAQTILEQAQQQGMQQGMQQGQEQGYKDGFAQASSEVSERAKNFDKVMGDVLQSKDDVYKGSQEEMLDLVMMLAEKLACVVIKEDKESLKNIIVEACNEIKEKETLRILVHPSFAAKIYSISDELTNTIYSLQNLKIIEDKTISTDGVVLESLDSRVDARLASRVDLLMRSLKQEVKRTPLLKPDAIADVNVGTATEPKVEPSAESRVEQRVEPRVERTPRPRRAPMDSINELKVDNEDA